MRIKKQKSIKFDEHFANFFFRINKGEFAKKEEK